MKRMTAVTAAAVLAVLAVLAIPGTVQAQDGGEQMLTLTGVNYTKWLWGNQRYDGSLYNFTTIPDEGFGDNGQGTEFEILVASRPTRWVEVNGRIKARFNQNFWTNFGGFGKPDGSAVPGTGACVGGDCGEYDPRSAQYMKFRGLTARITPGYEWLDAATIGSSDWGMFDPFTIGKIRYIDRDNGSGLLFQGGFADRKVTYDLARISLPRLWAGPNFQTGEYTSQDAAYGAQIAFAGNQFFDARVIYEWVNDVEVDASDFLVDDGRDLDNRFENDVLGLKVGIHPHPVVDLRAAWYDSSAESFPEFGTPTGFGMAGFSPVPAGKLDDQSWKGNVDVVDPFGIGLSFNVEVFDIGADYVSMMAARREADVLLTEGHDGTFAFPGPANAKFGVFAGNPTVIGYGGWQGHAQQVATINVDNEFTDFEEPMAETVIGWKGWTVAPLWTFGALELAGEYTRIDYNTNWQAWGHPELDIQNSPYPNHESDAGVGSYRNAYAPFQDKDTDIAVLRARYLLDVGKGIDVFGKVKRIDEQDRRMTDPRFLPFAAGDCPGGGGACANDANFYSDGNSTSSIYFNPPVITGAGGAVGYQWKPFDSLTDDDRDMDYLMVQLGAGYQLSDRLYASLTFERYDVDLQDGNTAFQAYQLHEMASGQHDKDKVILGASYILGGAEFGLNYEYNTGEFTPDFGGGFVPQVASEQIARDHGVPVGSLGFAGRFGGWNSLETRDFDQQRLKTFMKVRF